MDEAESDLRAELEVLQAEAIAVQAVLVALCRRLVRADPALAAAVRAAFEEAETIMSGLAVRIGIDAPMANTIGALRILEELRAAAITDEASCRAQE
ncbi:hypothetical protein [Sphingosinicella sp. LY1275]|uniref:hypothetical protein n=1 Tax=Sphingosinicella sp. LY1275 TaxID=3095379 RepID=UPI002ADEF602|nr:hypothetical protein [Sphingosinicella sp. LY1275]MEA1015400.1 hypothetical protein [Sphingosinicella sp. LY1275]